jgi:hypothetical protein
LGLKLSRVWLAFKTFPEDSQDGSHRASSFLCVCIESEECVVVAALNLDGDIGQYSDEVIIGFREPPEEQDANGIDTHA